MINLEPSDFDDYLRHTEGWEVVTFNNNCTIFVHESGVEVTIPAIKDIDYIAVASWALTRIAVATWREKVEVIEAILKWKHRTQ